MNTLTHLFGMIAAAIGGVLLLVLTADDLAKMLSMLVYAASMVILYLCSTLLHGVKLPPDRRMWLNRLDHMAIFLLIAGTYTPIAFNLLGGAWRWGVLIVVWTAALIGALFKLFGRRIHGFLNTSIYLVLGWGSVLPLLFAGHLHPLISFQALLLLLLGGFVYTLGFVIYYVQWPDPWPSVFGHHEIWHIFVLLGSLFHYLFILIYAVPATRLP